VILGHPALRLLARRKLAGMWRRQKSRLRRPSGILFAVLGAATILFWLGSTFLTRIFPSTGRAQAHFDMHELSSVGLALTILTLLSSLNFRGLYLPPEEIDRLFSAPLSRSDLVRYRLLTSLTRSLFGGLFFSAVIAIRTPVPLYGFVGALVAMLTLPVLGQAASLLMGDAESRLAGRLSKLPIRYFAGIFVALLLIYLVIPVSRRGSGSDVFASVQAWIRGAAKHPALGAVLKPFEPWARMMTAQELAPFLGWFSLCAVIWVALFEITARIRIDFRELSLETSADVARRIKRARRGALGASGTEASRKSASWRVPWYFGRGPFGAIAWRKSAAILRKARGTFLMSGIILSMLTFVSTFVRPEREAAALIGSMIIVAPGVLYLCSGLRYDFREDLDRMDVIKSYPLAPQRVFLATLLPQVAFVSLGLVIAVWLRAAITRDFHPWIIGISAAVPGVVLAWVAIDNAVFLFAPVRFVPGQEGVLHHAGRSIVLMLLRVALAMVVAVPLVVFLVVLAQVRGDIAHDPASIAIGSGFCVAMLAATDAALVYAGGRLLARFDVARDRG
jgi:hypothetical protein